MPYKREHQHIEKILQTIFFQEKDGARPNFKQNITDIVLERAVVTKFVLNSRYTKDTFECGC